VVTIALSTGEDSLFTRVNKHLDRSVARYADHFFESAAATTAREGQVGGSWRLMGKGVLTFLLDLALLPLMFFFLPFRLLILLLYTPVGLLQERSERKRSRAAVVGASASSARGLPEAGGWRGDSVGSVTEHTTVHLELAETSGGRADTSGNLSGKARVTSR
jgi:hypothetical protein